MNATIWSWNSQQVFTCGKAKLRNQTHTQDDVTDKVWMRGTTSRIKICLATMKHIIVLAVSMVRHGKINFNNIY
jgi:hypothetical protein